MFLFLIYCWFGLLRNLTSCYLDRVAMLCILIAFMLWTCRDYDLFDVDFKINDWSLDCDLNAVTCLCLLQYAGSRSFIYLPCMFDDSKVVVLVVKCIVGFGFVVIYF